MYNLQGLTFGRLTVLSKTKVRKAACIAWRCRCTCGAIKLVAGRHLYLGRIRSCGCLAVETTTQRSTTHGDAPRGRRQRTYTIWATMKQRCLNPKNHKFSRYGRRGIKICRRWMKYENFVADMGYAPRGRSIDRINNDGDYKPSNCRWATPKQQRNNRSDSR